MTDLEILADHAAIQSDRWWVCAVFIVLAIVLVTVWRSLQSDRNKLSDRLTSITDKHISTVEAMTARVTTVVENNTAVLNEVKRKL